MEVFIEFDTKNGASPKVFSPTKEFVLKVALIKNYKFRIFIYDNMYDAGFDLCFFLNICSFVVYNIIR